ncbi:MAG: cell division ATP-binding protein FtsE, partial [Clostridiaceae bacterium]|nr:cell division ATP-binding protein FtsE [Clostridiaceae bacterium]
MISFKNVTKIYDNNVVGLDNVSFTIQKGEFVFLVGQSGAGKSSIIKLLMAEELPTEGDVIFDGKIVNKLSRKEIPYLRRSIGVVFQDFRLLPKKTVYENVAYAMLVTEATKRQIRRQVPNVLSMVGLSRKARCYPNQLSGGEQQRVAIARAIVNNPSVLIADEPTGNLDNETAYEIMKILDDINKRGTTIIMATHSDRIVNDMRKRVIHLENGIILSDEEKGVYRVGYPA